MISKNLKKLILRIIFLTRARRRMKSGLLDDSLPPQLSSALTETIFNQTTSREKSCLGKVENLRKTLCLDKRPFQRMDFGAGTTRDDETGASEQLVTETIGQVACQASKDKFWSQFLFKLVRKFQANTCLELGTCFGISTAYLAFGVIDHEGRIVTLEGAPTCAEIAKDNFAELGLSNVEIAVGRFQDTLKEVLVKYAPFDFVFIDGHHEEKATLQYFEQICPYLSQEAVVVFDDIRWSAGMERAWHDLEDDDRIGLSLDLKTIGLCQMRTEGTEKTNLAIPLV